MATEGYWSRRQEDLLDPEFGALRLLEKSPRELLKGVAMAVANEKVAELRVLGLHDVAERLLDHYRGELHQLLDDAAICSELRHPKALRPPALIAHLETLAVANWLATGSVDRKTIKRVIVEVDESPQYRVRTLSPLSYQAALICAVESQDPQTVERFYGRWEKRPLTGQPTDLRFAGNPRHLLLAHLRFGRKPSARELLDRGLARLAERAKRWETPDAVPVVGIVELARILFQCERLKGRAIALDDLWDQLR